MSDIIFCGSGRKIEFDNGGSIMKLNLCLSELPEEFIREWNDKKWINLNVCKKKDQSNSKSTHYICVDTWRPDNKQDDTELPF